MPTTRRDFLKTSVLASSLLFVPKFLHALDRQELAALRDANGRRLVVVQLGGGNDGLNTIIPYRDDLYYKARPTLGIRPQSGILTLNKDLGLNPAMTRLKGLYDQGQVAVLNSVGYPNPDRSHFRSMDIWQSGSAAEEYLTTGWLGRYLDSSCPTCPLPYNGLEVDDTLSLAMKGAARKGLALKNPEKFHQLTQNRFLSQVSRQTAPAGGSELDYLYKTLAETASSADYLYQKSKVYQSATAYPNTEFGKSLKTTAELINSGVGSRVFYVSLAGFDTHVRQQEQQGKLLGDLSEGLGSFVEDLRKSGELDNTLILVFSEFGRRVEQNASNGTDHGTANNVLLLGGGLRRQGILNAAPDLQNLDQGDLKHQLDFRRIYATILHDWLGADDRAILGSSFERLSGLV
ncbi:Uncharacterized conserved protein, DUF1501 family [Hymenobacter daecheongensis DSM 21074]|uniref:Uncharacterized conserved protein, DUF1501 family n=1 Tax=Hymenobacter daecheongensis DSM 21074 TaxID=1121955 RepID=A0A1M6LIQ3_9BACT|nr:DUF1501 domain-containing protein [Hymenobacter daecheongensis]SHJ71073.1 Uncharacterized conserved protein, DUF1501 family [Hymenobacter daecheongensis DSM 21074]